MMICAKVFGEVVFELYSNSLENGTPRHLTGWDLHQGLGQELDDYWLDPGQSKNHDEKMSTNHEEKSK
jgi:hypothetical protein